MIAPPQVEVPSGPAPRVRARADAVLLESGLLANPYFEILQNGGMSLGGFRVSQEQFYFAVAFFSRPMAGLVARLADYEGRASILRNIVEEHGGFCAADSHARTFIGFLESISARDPSRPPSRPVPAVHAFNSVLFSACLLEELPLSIACLGIIEYAFASLSAQIADGVVSRGWVAPENLVHYSLHAALDRVHAEEFFALIEPHWEELAQREAIERGLALGAHIFDRLYRELLALALAPDAVPGGGLAA